MSTAVYIILGPADSGRREILTNLIQDGLDNAAPATASASAAAAAATAASAAPAAAAFASALGSIPIIPIAPITPITPISSATTAATSAAAAPVPPATTAAAAVRIYLPAEFSADALTAFADATHAEVLPWKIAAGSLDIASPETAPETVFIVTDGTQSPVDQMEILAALLPRLGWEIARIFTVVHCALLEKFPDLEPWFNACLHFSDAALLSRRANVANNWLRKFTDAYRESCNPCLLELAKKGGKVENARRLLIPEARRLSKIFDNPDPLDDMEFDEDNLPDEPFDLVVKPDPYFERLPSGVRRLQIPDIREFSL